MSIDVSPASWPGFHPSCSWSCWSIGMTDVPKAREGRELQRYAPSGARLLAGYESSPRSQPPTSPLGHGHPEDHRRQKRHHDLPSHRALHATLPWQPQVRAASERQGAAGFES